MLTDEVKIQWITTDSCFLHRKKTYNELSDSVVSQTGSRLRRWLPMTPLTHSTASRIHSMSTRAPCVCRKYQPVARGLSNRPVNTMHMWFMCPQRTTSTLRCKCCENAADLKSNKLKWGYPFYSIQYSSKVSDTCKVTATKTKTQHAEYGRTVKWGIPRSQTWQELNVQPGAIIKQHFSSYPFLSETTHSSHIVLFFLYLWIRMHLYNIPIRGRRDKCTCNRVGFCVRVQRHVSYSCRVCGL